MQNSLNISIDFPTKMRKIFTEMLFAFKNKILNKSYFEWKLRKVSITLSGKQKHVFKHFSLSFTVFGKYLLSLKFPTLLELNFAKKNSFEFFCLKIEKKTE